MTISPLSAAGNRIVTAQGQPLRLLGVNRSGTEYECIHGWGLSDGPMDDASVAAIASWGTTAVRVSLNEDCWLGINGSPAQYSGASYQQFISSYVDLLAAHGLYAVVDLHWNAPGAQLATDQQQMADGDHAPAFWTSVAGTLKSRPNVVFDLYNEPHDVDWNCWLNGGTCAGVSYQVAGMQSLVNTVRATGATNLILLAGLSWANDDSQWLSHKPNDPANNLAASWHNYNFNSNCNTESCWNANAKVVTSQVPLVVGEIGENDCAHGYIDGLMSYLDSFGASYLAWGWIAGSGSCAAGPTMNLISDYAGTPTSYGSGFRQHLLGLGPAPTSVPTATSTGTPFPLTPTRVPPTSTPVPSTSPTPVRATATSTPIGGGRGISGRVPIPRPVRSLGTTSSP
ncbi:MAG: cellulase family glycosylhydrolase [Chloroflexi bacterium]|nr:cellulase family glycosylhydrolase [Chloroflexota bacterium]